MFVRDDPPVEASDLPDHDTGHVTPDSHIHMDPVVLAPHGRDDTTQLVLRALVSTKEAGVIIGKDGATVAGLRDAAKVKAGVTKSVAGIPDRILSVAGTAAGVAHAIGLAAAALVAHPPSGYVLNLVPPGPQGTTTVRLLIPHQRMGSILGKGGARIKAIQAKYAVRIVASKHRLPHSSERIVEIQGEPQALQTAVYTVVQCLLEEKDKSILVAYYNPRSLEGSGTQREDTDDKEYVSFAGYRGRHTDGGSDTDTDRDAFLDPAHASNGNLAAIDTDAAAQPNSLDAYTQSTIIPASFAGYIIGRRGDNIRELRKRSGAAISISSEYESERTLLMRGTEASVTMAMAMLQQQMDEERERRARAGSEDGGNGSNGNGGNGGFHADI
ncbi:RNA-binding protein [Yarrowia sp. C11]|nr:RNA-binding protein [Yarrowia sp. E02]KAG5369825.1 RNA-binding protein [Yarrowia sp. C11]